MLIRIEALVNLGTNKQYPTLAAIYSRQYMTKQVMKLIALSLFLLKFTRFLSKDKS